MLKIIVHTFRPEVNLHPIDYRFSIITNLENQKLVNYKGYLSNDHEDIINLTGFSANEIHIIEEVLKNEDYHARQSSYKSRERNIFKALEQIGLKPNKEGSNQ